MSSFFSQLNRNVKYEEINYAKRPLIIPSQAPYQQFEKDLYSSSKVIHEGDQIFNKIPYEVNNSRILLDYENGRNLSLLKSISDNSKPIMPVLSHSGQGSLGFL
jgi:hypothetical protein